MDVTVFYDLISTATSRTSFVGLQDNLIPHFTVFFHSELFVTLCFYFVIISLVLDSPSKLHTNKTQVGFHTQYQVYRSRSVNIC